MSDDASITRLLADAKIKHRGFHVEADGRVVVSIPPTTTDPRRLSDKLYAQGGVKSVVWLRQGDDEELWLTLALAHPSAQPGCP